MGSSLLIPILSALTALAAIPVWAGWLISGRGGFAVFLLVTALLVATAWRFVGAYGDDPRWDVRVMDAFAIVLSIVVVLGLTLGTLGLLRLHVLMLALAVVAICPHPQPLSRRERGEERPPLQLPLSSRERGLGGEGASWSLANITWPHAILAGLVAFGIGQVARDRGFLPPVGDAIGYHLPFVGEWIQSGSLTMPVPAAGDPSPPFYPLNSSLWMFWTAAPFESDVLARFVQAPFFVLLFIAVVRLGMEIRLPPAGALTAGLLTLSLPDVIRGLSLAENDVILAALLVAATANLTVLWSGPTVWRAAMGAVWLGLAMGTKVPAVPFAAVLGVVWVAIVIYHWRPEGWKRVATLALMGAAIVVVLGGYSYFRNAVVMENPSYPVRMELGGEEVLPGLYTASREWKESHPFYPFDWAAFFGFGMRGFFGWTVPLLILPGLALTLVRIFRGLIRRRGRTTTPTCHPERSRRISFPPRSFRVERRSFDSAQDDRLAPLLLAVWCGVWLAIFWFIIPYHFERFLYATLAWGIVVAIWGWLILFRERETLLAILVIPLALVNVSSLPLQMDIWRRPAYIVAAMLVVLAVAAGVLLARAFRARMTLRAAAPVVTAIALVLVAAWPVYADRYEEQRFDQWGRLSGFLGSQPETWRWLWETTDGEPATIAVAGTNATFPLYGPSLENRVLTISRDGQLQEYDWDRPFEPFGEPDRDRWLQTVQTAGIDYLWVTANVSFGDWPVEAGWAVELDNFEPVVMEDDLRVWRITGQ